MSDNYALIDEGTVQGVQYVTVLDSGGNPVEYNIPADEARERYQPDEDNGEDEH